MRGLDRSYHLFSQWDGPWSGIPLGTGGGHTLDSAGCLVTAGAGMLMDTFKVDTDPGRLNRWLCQNEGFTKGNLVVFTALARLGKADYSVVDCSNVPAPMDQVASVLEHGGGVLAKVDFIPGGPVNQHWVRILTVDDEDCLLHDPWLDRYDGAYSLMAKYGHWSWSGPARAIFRLAMYLPMGISAVAGLVPVMRAVQQEVCVRY